MWRALLDPLLPAACWACRRPGPGGEPLCSCCEAELPWLGQASGPSRHLDRAWAAAEFAGPARALVHALKFRGALGLAVVMAGQLADRAPAGLLDPGGLLVPVPAHPGRLRRRGFDPALLLARSLAARAGVPYADALRRDGMTGPGQRGAGRAERLGGERLGIAARGALSGRVVLVDDVWTTGATLQACALTLYGAGATSVDAIAYARVLDRPMVRATIPEAAIHRREERHAHRCQGPQRADQR